MLRIYSTSLGCPKNRVDTERTLGSIGPVRMVETPETAELIFINTCGFIGPAVEESVRTILEAIEAAGTQPKAKRPFIAVAGCLVGRYGAKDLAPDLPEVDLFLDNRDLAHWAEMLRQRLGLGPAPEGRFASTGPSYAWLKISDGCRHACSFCTIPAIRGPLTSHPEAMLVEEAAGLVHSGVKELVLVAQDVTSWGRDLGKSGGLKRLLEKLLPLPGLERLRLMYLYPAGLTRPLLSFLQEAGKPFVPYFDIPLQHASKNVLQRMGRPFAQNPRAAVERVREFFPHAALRTSIIVGFPGETEKDFQELCDFVQATRFHHLGVFAYQQEEGTPAATMPDQIPDKEKQWRRDALMEIQADISEELLQQYVGQTMDILVDAPQGEWPGLFTGRAWFQAPESDGVTYISGPGAAPGALVQAEITEAQTYDLVALVNAEEGE